MSIWPQFLRGFVWSTILVCWRRPSGPCVFAGFQLRPVTLQLLPQRCRIRSPENTFGSATRCKG
jgi:hypothetical protein